MDETLVRSALFVPGNRPERFAKALASGADVVIVDFEDAVQEADKAQARQQLGSFLRAEPNARAWVRVNGADHPQHEADLAFCATEPGVVALMLPKAESPEQIAHAAATGKPIIPIIESAKGVQALPAMAWVQGVQRLTYGGLDMSLDLGLVAGSGGAERMLDQVRFALLIHSRQAGLAGPLETVFADIGDTEGLEQFMANGHNMGFAGMLCIHPSQVGIIHQVLAPGQAARAWAGRVLQASAEHTGAFQLDGQMIDAPVIERARKILAATNNG
ncbi:HpcH/HpaI aldolase/citrate lyase family protein [Pseudomonas typographi]|uniref:CoA ester lyase n=1 Tax=Pseudomonas typographi TaxID=2715964 RepID=A0ABR7YWG5_9PSED|nr:CoA ester lyase [Pseudomonas typographi]MBD1552459.1 CoA ester lyase [Pseudomonas typographi]MBD1585549.1 CoA ester lyase [Pseudomonas typographi]MBD1597536.1 CoA ester lyase [Pseudomonas typographi]